MNAGGEGEPKMAPNSMLGWPVVDGWTPTEERVSELGGGVSGDPFAFILGRRIYFPKHLAL